MYLPNFLNIVKITFRTICVRKKRVSTNFENAVSRKRHDVQRFFLDIVDHYDKV